MNKKFSGILTIIILAGFTIGAIGQSTNSEVPMDTFLQALKYIQSYYVDEKKTDGKELVYGAIRGMMETLDPHSQFMTSDQFKDLMDDAEGSFGGLGIQISIRNNLLTVISPIDDTPAYRAGIKSGDKIIKIEGTSTENYTVDDAIRKLRGPIGTKVLITIFREGIEPFDVAITRAKIGIESIKSHILNDSTGYVRITNFSRTTADDLEKVLKEFLQKKIKFIVLDLRNNPGGLLDSAADAAGKFLKKGDLVVYTKARVERFKQPPFVVENENQYKFPMVILVNGGTASGAEIVTGAIQDHKRGVVIGTKTFGKGSVQTTWQLPERAGIKITTAYYYTPSGRLIHDKGIIPDIIIEEKNYDSIVDTLYDKEYYTRYAREYVKKHPDADVNIKISNFMTDNFVQLVRKDGFSLTDETVQKNIDAVRKYIKMEIMREAKGEKSVDLVRVLEDEIVKRGMETLKAVEVLSSHAK